MIARCTIAAAIAALSFAAAVPASAQTYPDHPITMIVPLAPGGSTDTLGRIMAKAMSATLGQTVVVENVGGAAGTIGVTRAERSAPDGYTVLWGMWGTNVADGAIYNLGFDYLTDFEPVALAVTQPFLIDARKTMPANNLKELVAWIKANPRQGDHGHLRRRLAEPRRRRADGKSDRREVADGVVSQRRACHAGSARRHH